MKVLKVLPLVLIFVDFSLGGSFSYCGQLKSSFTVLYEAINAIIDISEASSEDPALGNAFAFSLDCKFDQSIALIVDGTSRLTELDPNYILGIITGEIDQPFQSPLDCIIDGLIAVRFMRYFMKNVAVPALRSNFVPSSTSDFNCSLIQGYSEERFKFYAKEVEEKLVDFYGLATSFNNINMLDLFINFLAAHQHCSIDSLAYIAAGSVNGDETKALAYLTGTNNLPFPLNCTKVNIGKYSTQIADLYSDALDKIIYSEPSSIPPTCETLNEAVVDLKDAVFGILSRVENHTLYGVMTYPNLIPGYIENVQCKIETIFLTISRRLEEISNITWTDIMDILQGRFTLPLNEPLNCIQDDLVQISHRAEYVSGDFVKFLGSMVQPPQELWDPSCDQIEHMLGNMTDTIHSFVDEMIEELRLENEEFLGLQNGYNYVSNIMSQECDRKSLARIFSSVLNGDFESVLNVLILREAIDFPYTCVVDSMLTSLEYARQLSFEAGLYYL